MTDIEDKALALLNEVRKGANPESEVTFVCRDLYDHEALCRAIEQHEAFRQEVSDAVVKAIRFCKDGRPASAAGAIGAFVIPAPKTDPLVDVFCKGLWSEAGLSISTKEIRAALDARGLEIKEKSK
jgi:hypothetical protein